MIGIYIFITIKNLFVVAVFLVELGNCSLNACNRSESCDGDTTLVHGGDCQKYYRCVYNVWTELPCGDLYFDAVTCGCVREENAKCLSCPTVTPVMVIDNTTSPVIDNTTSPVIDNTTSPAVTSPNIFLTNNTSEPITTMSTTTTESSWSCLSGCSLNLTEECTDGERSASTVNCTNYYWCVFKKWTHHSCMNGLKFNPVNCACDHESPSCSYICPGK